MSRRVAAFFALLLFAPFDAAPAQATNGISFSETVLYAKKGAPDGAEPEAPLIFDANALYGAAINGGAYGGGAVFKLIPPSSGQIQWTEQVLYSFTGGADGSFPSNSLIMDASGASYGTTRLSGGTQSGGAVFRLAPPAGAQTTWTASSLHQFTTSGDGYNPAGNLVFGADGALYGATQSGGTGNCVNRVILGCGVIYKLTPPAAGQTQWTEQIIHDFRGKTSAAVDGQFPSSLVFGADGALYGTTTSGGTYGVGVVFKLTPPAAGQSQWTSTILYSFQMQTDANSPVSLAFGTGGALFGAATSGGGSGNGAVFKLAPSAGGSSSWTESVIYSFAGAPDGMNPVGVVVDAIGSLYGATNLGGSVSCAATVGCGTAFKLTPPAAGQTQWTETLLHSFAGGTDGALPTANVALGPNGTVYGPTYEGGVGTCGGSPGCGVVYAISTPFTVLAIADVGDFYGAGRNSSILWRSVDGTVATSQVNGSTFADGGSGPLVTSDWTIVGAGDFFNTGQNNGVLWRNSNGTVATWEVNGAGITAIWTGPVVTSDWTIVGIGDFFNTDHNNGVLWRNSNGTVATWEVNGAGITAVWTGPVVSSDWTIAGTGDFFNTGHNNGVLWRNSNGTVATWEVNGAGITAAWTGPVVSSDWTIAGTGDFYDTGHNNGILWRNSNGTVATWEVSGSGIIASWTGPVVASDWTISGAGDFAKSGHDDGILWRNADGTLATWEVSGSAIVASRVVQDVISVVGAGR